MKTKDHTQTLCKIMFDQIKSEWGNGWKHLGDQIKRAIIAERVLFTLIGRDGSTTPEKMLELRNAMLFFCGLEVE